MSIYNMSNKIKIKKHILKYGYLKLEKQEVDEICENMEKEIRSYFEKNFPDQFKEFNNLKQKQIEKNLQKQVQDAKIEEKEETSTAEEPTIREEVETLNKTNPDIKRMYRKIAEKSHPDKVGNDSLAQIFSEAANAYKTQDVGKLLDLASLLNIEFTNLSEDTIFQLEKNIKLLNDHIVNKKSTTAWKWYTADSDEVKKNIIMHILSCEGIV